MLSKSLRLMDFKDEMNGVLGEISVDFPGGSRCTVFVEVDGGE